MVGKQLSNNKTGYEIKEEKLTWELYHELLPLLEVHWEEIADDKDKIKLNPDDATYFLMQEKGLLHCLICRFEGKIVGYLVTFLMHHPHYKDHIYAQNDIFFLHKDHRKGTLGYRLITEHEKYMKDLGVSIILYHFKPKKDFSKLLERAGHSFFELTYRKYIGD